MFRDEWLPPEATDLLRRCGGAARRKWLLRAGLSPHGLKRLVTNGTLIRPAYGWYAVSDVHPDISRARVSGGSLTGPSALQPRGAWRAHDRRLHVRVDRKHRIRRTKNVCVHREPRLANATQVVVDNVAAAYLACFECQPIDELVAIGDSLIREQLLDYEPFVAICAQSGRKGRRVRQYTDAAADSGPESLLRARLRALRIKLTTQWPVRGARRYDMKIGRSLLIETDGREHHDRPEAFHNDRDVDQVAVSRGYVVMRLTYRHVVHEWPDTLERILTFVRHRWHLRRPVELTA